MSKKSQGIRSRRTADGVVELWLGEPGEAESDRILSVSDFYIPGILHVLENIKKSPLVDKHTYD